MPAFLAANAPPLIATTVSNTHRPRVTSIASDRRVVRALPSTAAFSGTPRLRISPHSRESIGASRSWWACLAASGTQRVHQYRPGRRDRRAGAEEGDDDHALNLLTVVGSASSLLPSTATRVMISGTAGARRRIMRSIGGYVRVLDHEIPSGLAGGE